MLFIHAFIFIPLYMQCHISYTVHNPFHDETNYHFYIANVQDPKKLRNS